MSSLFRRLLIITSLVFAAPSYGFEATDKVNGETWQRIGSATYSVLFFTAYDIALYSPDGSYDASAPHALAIRYRMDFTADEINDRSIEEMERSAPLADSARTRYREALDRVIPGVKEGDVIRAVFTPGEKTAFSKNGKATGEVADADFTREFSGIWLAEDTNAPELRAKLVKR